MFAFGEGIEVGAVLRFRPVGQAQAVVVGVGARRRIEFDFRPGGQERVEEFGLQAEDALGQGDAKNRSY